MAVACFQLVSSLVSQNGHSLAELCISDKNVALGKAERVKGPGQTMGREGQEFVAFYRDFLVWLLLLLECRRSQVLYIRVPCAKAFDHGPQSSYFTFFLSSPYMNRFLL